MTTIYKVGRSGSDRASPGTVAWKVATDISSQIDGTREPKFIESLAAILPVQRNNPLPLDYARLAHALPCVQRQLSADMSSSDREATRHVVVVGAGIVGLSVAYQLSKEHFSIDVVDQNPEGDKTSAGNAGGIAITEVVPASIPGLLRRIPGMLLDPLGPLSVRPRHALKLLPWALRFSRAGNPAEVTRIAGALSALNARAYAELLPLLSDIGSMNQLHRDGALTVYGSDEGFKRDTAGWNLKRYHSIEALVMSGDEARRIEPELSPLVRHAVYTPQWSHISDPRDLLDTLRRWLQRKGVKIVSGRVVDVRPSNDGQIALSLSAGSSIAAGRVVIAGGAWSADLARRCGDKVILESERGYNTTFSDSRTHLNRTLIFAEHGFVATPLAIGLRIGGAAEFGGLSAAANFNRARILVRVAQNFLPNLTVGRGIEWAGHRPATPDSLPVIGRSPTHPNVFYAFGHGHLGLTQAAITGRLIADMIVGRPPIVDVVPYSIDRFS